MGVLDITYGASRAEVMWPDREMSVTVATPEEFIEGKYPNGEYDVVLCAHTLQYVDSRMVKDFMDTMAKSIKNHGEVWVIVPSLEWAAAGVLDNSPDPLIQAVMFGQERAHRSGYTLLWLRALIEGAGLVTRQAKVGAMEIQVEIGATNDQEVRQIPQNTVIGMRNDDVHDLSTAD